MTLPPWADSDMSQHLGTFCRAGESASLEFKRQLPEQARDLAKEIAAFSSSGEGVILIGVDDDGTIVGMPGMEDIEQRDRAMLRTAGICKAVNPPVRPELKWACTEGHTVLCIVVAKGREPLYYVEQRPYVRHANTSNPAEPAEVIEAVRRYLVQRDQVAPETHHLSSLAQVLATVLRWTDTDPEVRELNPWAGLWENDASVSAATLRNLAIEPWAEEQGHTHDLEALAEAVEKISNGNRFLDDGEQAEGRFQAVRTLASELMATVIAPVPLDLKLENDVKELIRTHSRQLKAKWKGVAKELFDGRLEEAQINAGSIGRQMTEFTYYRLGFLSEDDRNELRRLTLALIKLEAEQLYFDGGQSQQRVVDMATSLAEQIAHIVTRFRS